MSFDNRKNKDYIKFITYLAIVIGLTYPLMGIVSRSWNTGMIDRIADSIRIIPSGISFLINIVLGFYTGSICLMFLDRKKKIQAIILLTGIVITVYYMFNSFNIRLDIVYIIIGYAIGYFLGGGPRENPEHEYRSATRNVTYFSILYIIFSYLSLYFLSNSGQNNENFIIDSIVVFGFSIFFKELMGYTAKSNIFILGPGRSGKTMFLAGCYTKAFKKSEISCKPNDNLKKIFNQLNTPNTTTEEKWPVAQTLQAAEYSFIYETGKLFPKETKFRSFDFPGVFLDKIPEAMDQIGPGLVLKKDASPNDPIIITALEVLKSDRIIFIIDGEKYPNFGEMGIVDYLKINDRLRERGKNIECYIVVTKCDIFMDEYPNASDYEGFKHFVEEKLLKNMNVEQLTRETYTRSLYPVLFDTKLNNSGKRVPLRDDGGNIIIRGFDRILEDMFD